MAGLRPWTGRRKRLTARSLASLGTTTYLRRGQNTSKRGLMRHGYMYNGAYELNYTELAPNKATYKTTDGTERALPAWPEKIDGVRIGYMEKSGKKFYA